ncbi:hypothetical protein MVES1_000504 [Malassezia vespertilionis]|uniref:DUF7137 domain-containing protein n=1 Tax=Malassezia vespertilionis TaxID=2020962 RepID=A0A2N1JG84_9BASI|nr:uncharacterized protein MVES1_000504 [Malassezia vespertilionis]PKI85560.1 hypothetical protein MVES_000465 [Malassezia vespertilionis]WFD05178.1 hypothetical protein MVES1_000504 [Malassezia vespertilionis]
MRVLFSTLLLVWTVQVRALASSSGHGAIPNPRLRGAVPTPATPVRRAAVAAPTLSARGADDDKPAGGLTVTHPPQTDQLSYFKIAPHVSVTFGWSYTSLSTTPEKLYIVASCSQNGNTYPIAPSPAGIPATQTSVTWYPYGYRTQALAQGLPDLDGAKYRLMIYDDNGPDAVPLGGHFAPNNAVEFSLYYPKHYTPLSEWQCSSCNAASGLDSRSPFAIAALCTLLLLACSALWIVPLP